MSNTARTNLSPPQKNNFVTFLKTEIITTRIKKGFDEIAKSDTIFTWLQLSIYVAISLFWFIKYLVRKNVLISFLKISIKISKI